MTSFACSTRFQMNLKIYHKNCFAPQFCKMLLILKLSHFKSFGLKCFNTFKYNIVSLRDYI